MMEMDAAMLDLFREEVRQHTATLTAGLLELEADPTDPRRLEALMRAAHSLKGAARIMGVDVAVRLAHVMEDALVAAQNGRVRIGPAETDYLLQGTDVLAAVTAEGATFASWSAASGPAVDRLEPVFRAIAAGEAPPALSPLGRGVRGEGTAPTPVASDTRVEGLPLTPNPPPQRGEGNITAGPPPFTPRPIPGAPIPLSAEHGMFDLFREEVRSAALILTAGLADFAPDRADAMADALRAVQGAATMVKAGPVEAAARDLAAALSGPVRLDWLGYAVDRIAGAIDTTPATFPAWAEANAADLWAAVEGVRDQGSEDKVSREPASAEASEAGSLNRTPQPPSRSGKGEPDGTNPASVSEPSARSLPSPPRGGAGVEVEPPTHAKPAPSPPPPAPPPTEEAVVRVTAQSLNRLMGLAGESLVMGRWLQPFSAALLRLRKQHDALAARLDTVSQAVVEGAHGTLVGLIADAKRQAAGCRQELIDQMADFDDHAAAAEDLNTRLYREVIVSRMRPFADGTHGFPRLVRDMARAMDKQAKLDIRGQKTEVDRDILERLEAPLSHLIRNAVDHGLEAPDVREKAGKPRAGTVRLEAVHRAGMLSVTVGDDGAGIDPERLRRKIVEKKLSSAEMSKNLTEAELLEFLFLPGFSTASKVSEFSGRGVGLDVVQDTVRKVGGSVRVTSKPGKGTTFHLQVPITLSVIRAVVADVAGEPYAFPHNRIDRLLRVPRAEIRSIEGRQFATVDGVNVGLVVAAQVLDLPAAPPTGPDLPVVLLSDASGSYGLVVDAFRGEQDLVVRPLDPRLGKVPNMSAAAILDDGSPVLIVDTEDLVRAMDHFIQTGSLKRCDDPAPTAARRKRVLVVDDSITVREVERQILLHKGYDVTVAVDGVDGWNQLRDGRFDLLVSDVDMPRMTGLQLVKAVRDDPRLKELPAIIVSYKDREEDRLRGMEVGANYYLTKSAFHDDRFARAVEDLIGGA